MDGYGQRVPIEVSARVNPCYKVGVSSKIEAEYIETESKDVQNPADIEFKVSGKAKNVSKILSYTSDSGGIISYGGKVYSPGDEIPIGKKTDITLSFVPEKIGTAHLAFTFGLEHGDAEKKEVPVDIVVNGIVMSLTPDNRHSPLYANKWNGIKFSIETNLSNDIVHSEITLKNGKLKLKLEGEELTKDDLQDRFNFTKFYHNKEYLLYFMPVSNEKSAKLTVKITEDVYGEDFIVLHKWKNIK